ncbi:hypothetical protein F5Y12DRAFT_795113 [Xylaria sp. FL1777]|nr:hypothetical protein F5Y12DRAFT_795113 [Xylaria sp. FL1777]
MRSTLERLPTELRSLIWNAVGEQETFDSLMMASSLIRDEILDGIPGALLLSCNCPHNRPCCCGRGFEIERLAIIVDCHCSEKYWLKFYIYPRRRSTPSVWSIADLDAPLAQVLRYYRPQETTIEFQLAKGSACDNGARYMVLRAKLFDVCEILGWFQPQRERRLRINFAEPLPLEVAAFPSPWDTKLTHSVPCHPDILGETTRRREIIDKDSCPWEKRPLFYESLLMPLILNSNWSNSEVTFDGDSGNSSTFNYQHRNRGVLVKSELFDHKLLEVTAWAYIGQLITEGSVKLDDDDLTPYFEQYDSNAKIWAAEKPRRRTLQTAFHSCLLAMIESGIYFDLLLEGLSLKPENYDQLESLRSHIRRTRDLSSSNSFSRDHPNNEATSWLWNLEPIRQSFLAWEERKPGGKNFEYRGWDKWETGDSFKLYLNDFHFLSHQKGARLIFGGLPPYSHFNNPCRLHILNLKLLIFQFRANGDSVITY